MGGRGAGTIVIITTGRWNFGLLAWNRLARRWRLHCEFDRWFGRLALVATHWSRPSGGPPSSAPLKVSEPAWRTNYNSAKEEAEGARAASSAVISGSDAGGWRMIRVGVAGAGAWPDGACSLGVGRLIPRNLREERGDSSAFAAILVLQMEKVWTVLRAGSCPRRVRAMRALLPNFCGASARMRLWIFLCLSVSRNRLNSEHEMETPRGANILLVSVASPTCIQ